ncbi:MAG TPA: RagB/SusD family nutrient uptake outer membrane protein [Ferruginibacter sp.]|mgnify:CR=1 FL=1|nr:RagB/SusD family nutrient uptake outer membrane protein [Ferruginibacter sp.]HMP20669.1 RagB/SusD family nutrient uptake outer membrane protein [Ferruginibacter sp.]
MLTLKIKTALPVVCSCLLLLSCKKNLDLKPLNDVTSANVYATPLGYKQVLAKIYGTMALTGNQGPTDQPDVFFQGADEGQNADFFRTFWKAQELPTDEAIITWGDPGVQDFHNMNWTPSNLFLTGCYYKCYYAITVANEYLSQAADAKLSSKGFSPGDIAAIQGYRNEARFMRAFNYWVLLDLFGNVPFVDENSQIGGPPATQIKRSDLFAYIESELKDIETGLPAPRTNDYGRADRAAAWSLLARLYLNAEVYTGTAKYTDAITYSKRVIDAGYSLITDYRQLMLADNHRHVNEFIFTINYDGLRTQGFGGTTFLTHASIGGAMNAADYGVNSGWAGIRTTSAFVNKFPDNTGATDKRAQFYAAGQNLEVASPTTFTDGWAITKYRNVTSLGLPGSDLTFTDIDMPIFRLSEMYLIYAEAVRRGGTGGDENTAIGYINTIRRRAFGNNSGDITNADFTTDFILDERARELYWEGHRRTDLIRHNKFTEGTYLWPWKGGISGGTAVRAFRKLYPIPALDINVNQNLQQNPEY